MATKLIISKIGTHVSIAGGIWNAPKRAHALGCETFQCFTRPPQGGPAPKLDDYVSTQFEEEMKKYNMETFYIHAPYYINLASLNSRIRYSSIGIIRDELERGSMLGAKYVVTHIGSHTNQTVKEGISKVLDAIKKILNGYNGKTGLLLEISAGTGNIIGDTFKEIGDITKKVKHILGFAGICFDTCHAFASGYDFRTKVGVDNVLKELDKEIGLDYLKFVHVNDSKVDLGEKKDRHEHIGDGFIKKEGISNILTTSVFSKVDWVLETEDSKRKKDVLILKKIRG